MNNANIFDKPPTFTNKNGESLELTEIMKKNITSVIINYLAGKKEVKANGIKGILGFKKVIAGETKELTIKDPRGIRLYLTDGIESATIRFWDKKEFEKIPEGSYDESTLFKRYVMTMISPYQINFHIGNLKSIDWEDD